jgi:hypothetical protein
VFLVDSFHLIQYHITQFFNQIGWNTLYNLKFQNNDEIEHLIEAYVTLDNWIITIIYSKDSIDQFKELLEKNKLNQKYEQKFLLSSSSEIFTSILKKDPYPFHAELYDFLAGIAYHEFGHSKECPIENDLFSEILQAITTALEQKNKFGINKLLYICNLFTDLVVNAIYGLDPSNSFFRNSIFTHHISELDLFANPDQAFLLFIILNAKIYQQNALMRNFLKEKTLGRLVKGYEVIISNILSIFCPNSVIRDKMSQEIELKEDEKWQVINYLTETEIWSTSAYDFALEIMDFTHEEEMLENPAVPNSIFTENFKNDTKFREMILDKILDKKISVFEENLNEEKEPNKKKEGKSGSSSTKPVSESYAGEMDINFGMSFCTKNKIFDGFYRHRVKQMDITIQSAESNPKFVYGWLNREIINENENLMNFDPFNLFFLPKSEELILYRRKLPLYEDSDSSTQKNGFPNLAIFCDDSGSMDWNPLEGNGKYDAVIIMIYSLMEWLKSKKIAPIIEYNLTLFSNTTRTSNWIDYFHINEFLPILFSYEGGGTVLDPKIFKNILENPKKSIVILITDGEIYNSKKIKEILLNNRSKMIFLFVQIGKKSKFATEIEKRGFNIYQITNISDLSDVVLEFIEKTYLI